MRPALIRTAIWGPLIILALLLAAYVIVHQPLAADDTNLHQVELDPSDPSRERVGDLVYLGGLDIPRMGQNIGGLSALRWDPQSGRLLAITDDARWVWITPTEQGDRLIGIQSIQSGPLLGQDGEPLSGKEEGDSESLTPSLNFGWLVGFERDHRILRYSAIDAVPDRVPVDPGAPPPDPQEILGPLEDNNGMEAMAGNEGLMFACAERTGTDAKPNCVIASQSGERVGLGAQPPDAIARLGGVPTDVALQMKAENEVSTNSSAGTLYVLFRSYSQVDGNGAAIIAYDLSRDFPRRELMILRPPLTVDNFEGLAVREEGARTFLYIVSDDNFSGSQRTLLMKFEVLSETE